MFIRPVGVTVHAANRPAGRPLLRGLLARAAGAVEATAGVAGTVTDELETPPRGLLGRAVRAARDAEVEVEEEARVLDEGVAEWEPEHEYEPEREPEYAPEHEPEPWPPDADSPGEPPPATAPAPPTGLVSELTQLAALAREGLLTPEEFAMAKERLLRD